MAPATATTATTATTPAAPVSPELMQQLAELLAAGDADAVEFFSRNRDHLKAVLRDQVDAIERAIGNFDFEAALEALRAAAAET